jgi:hypothetical protein
VDTLIQHYGREPENDLEKAYFHLEAGAPRSAARLFREEVRRGRSSPNIAYHWALSIVSGRPFDQLDRNDQNALRAAYRAAATGDGDGWRAALRVVELLLDCYSRQQLDENLDRERLDAAFLAYDRLPVERKREIGRHLRDIVGGVVKDRLDQARRGQIRAERLGRGRRRRVPLFFQPDPAEPRQRSVRPRQTELADVAAFGLGTIVAGIAAFAAFVAVWRVDRLAAGLLGLLWLAGAFCLVVVGPESRSFSRAVRSWMREIEPVEPSVEPLRTLVLSRLDSLTPDDPDSAARFRNGTAAERDRLIADLRAIYGSVAEPAEIEWLVRWHAYRIGRAWRERTLPSLRLPPAPVPGRVAALRLVLGLVAGAGLAVAALVRAHQPLPLLLAVAAAIGLYAGERLLLSGEAVVTEPLRYRAEVVAAERLYDQERAAWWRERERLADRPTDKEMADWLEYDKDHVRGVAMTRWGLTNSDVISQVVFTELVTGCRSARRTGPIRYSRYEIRVFLLTGNGVRSLRLTVDADSGAENRHEWLAFRYDAIASVVVEEPTTRRGGRRQLASREGGGPEQPPRPILRQLLELRLLNDQKIEIRIDYENRLTTVRPDWEELFALELDSSGAVSTLRTLETVAGEGKEWIRRERERMRHVAAEFEEGEPVPTG